MENDKDDKPQQQQEPSEPSEPSEPQGQQEPQEPQTNDALAAALEVIAQQQAQMQAQQQQYQQQIAQLLRSGAQVSTGAVKTMQNQDTGGTIPGVKGEDYVSLRDLGKEIGKPRED